MPVWAYWVVFLAVGVLAVAAAKRLDDLARKRRASAPPGPPAGEQT